MTELVLESKYIDVLNALGNLQENLEEAVRRYAIEQIGERIGKLQREILTFQTKYGVPYEMFYAVALETQEVVKWID